MASSFFLEALELEELEHWVQDVVMVQIIQVVHLYFQQLYQQAEELEVEML
jgi:hypothetical protein